MGSSFSSFLHLSIMIAHIHDRAQTFCLITLYPPLLSRPGLLWPMELLGLVQSLVREVAANLSNWSVKVSHGGTPICRCPFSGEDIPLECQMAFGV